MLVIKTPSEEVENLTAVLRRGFHELGAGQGKVRPGNKKLYHYAVVLVMRLLRGLMIGSRASLDSNSRDVLIHDPR